MKIYFTMTLSCSQPDAEQLYFSYFLTTEKPERIFFWFGSSAFLEAAHPIQSKGY